MPVKKFEVGICKSYWKYFTVEAETEGQARVKACEMEEKDNLPKDIGSGWSDWNNASHISDVREL